MQEIDARDGTRIAFRVTGDGPARIALVHSLALDHRFWEPVAERLSGHATVVSIDCRGHGASETPEGPYTVELFAEDLADILVHLGWKNAIVAGASMGGCVALAFAGLHPEMTSGLGLFDTTAWYGPTAPDDWEGRAQKARANGMASLVEFQKVRWFGDSFREDHPDVLEKYVDIFTANDVAAYVETCRMLGRADLRPFLPAIRVPARILVGEEDFATPPAMAEALYEAIPGARFDVIGGGRHLTPLEYPDRIADELKYLISETAK